MGDSELKITTGRALASVLLAAIALSAAHGCAAGAPRGGSQTSSTAAGTSQRPARPLAHASTFDTTPAAEPVRGGASDTALASALERAARAHGLTPDGRLAELALAIADASDGAQKPPSYPLVRFHAHRAGIAEPTPQVWLASGPDVPSLVPALEQALDDATRSAHLTHCGAAAVPLERGVVVALALSTRAFSLRTPIPRSVPVGATIPLHGELAAGYSTPSLAVTNPEDAVSRVALGRARSFSREVVADRAGETTLELLASGPEGLAVIAVVPVMVGAPVDTKLPTADALPVEADPSAVVQNLFAAIASERATRHLPPLRVDPRLSKIALAHSEDMVEHGFIAHTSKRTGDATARVQSQGLDARLVLENIGRGYSASELHRGLMESPGHRGNILHPDAREIGIGVVAEREGDRDAFIVTELFTQLTDH